MARIAILDYGMGNLRSVEKALERVGSRPALIRDPSEDLEADGLILPGVGAFPEAMRRIRERGFDRLIAARVDSGCPLLGICLGMQLLFDSSSEHEGSGGLGLLAGSVRPLRGEGLKVPHMGWSEVDWERSSPLTAGLDSAPTFYFVHSFVAEPADPGDLLGSAVHGERFAAVVSRGAVFGAQFHPEKSSATGLRLLANFDSICAPAALSA